METISNLNQIIIKNLVKLKKPDKRRQLGLIIVDGRREISLAVKNNWEIINLFYCPGWDKDIGASQFFNLERTKIIEVPKKIFKKICYKSKPDGFLATIKSRTMSLDHIKLKANPLIVVLENIEKPGNLGAILRTAAATGVRAVIVNDNQTDIYSPNVIRASEGQIFTGTLVKTSIKETVKWLKKNKIKSFGAATESSKNYTEVNLAGPLAIILGSEAQGLSPQWLQEAEQLIKIPMSAGMDSLNVSVAAAIILFEALRQRKSLS